jgi:hypothetical protein
MTNQDSQMKKQSKRLNGFAYAGAVFVIIGSLLKIGHFEVSSPITYIGFFFGLIWVSFTLGSCIKEKAS